MYLRFYKTVTLLKKYTSRFLTVLLELVFYYAKRVMQLIRLGFQRFHYLMLSWMSVLMTELTPYIENVKSGVDSFWLRIRKLFLRKK